MSAVTRVGPRPPRRGALAVGSIVALLCLFAAPAFLVAVVDDGGRSATATASVSDGDTTGNNRGRQCRATISFDVDGQRYEAKDRIDGPCPNDGGASTTEVSYDPDNPYDFTNETDGPFLYVFLGLSILGFLWAVRVLVTVVRARRAQRAQRAQGTPPPSMYAG